MTPQRPIADTRRNVLYLLLAMSALAAGVPKLLAVDTPSAGHADFDRWGYPEGSRIVVGAVETAAGLLILGRAPALLHATPRFWGTAGFAAMMLGAFGTHLAHAEMGTGIPSLFLLTVHTLGAYASRPAWLRRRPARATTTTG